MGRASLARLGAYTLCGLMLAAALGGCTRRFYRNRADIEVDQVLAEKDRYPFWKIEHFHPYPDPRARFADPTNPDRPPMPPDDPAAWQLSPHPQRPGKAGVARVEGDGYLRLLEHWDTLNRQLDEQKKDLAAKDPAQVVTQPPKLPSPQDETPDPFPPPKQNLEAPPGTPEHPFKLKMDQCVELGIINSRDFQTARETLYLAALPVTLQRFAFAAQWFATEQAIRERAGGLVPGGPRNDWTLNTNVGFSKLFSTGALLLLQFANKTVIDFTGAAARHTVSETTLNLDILQPLLRGGGKAVTLEPLTQSERDLLYAVRDYARFRKIFYTGITTGGDLNTFNPTPVRQGYLPTLLRAANLDIDQRNVANLVRIVKLIEVFQEGALVTPLQVDQAVSQLLRGRSAVITDVQDFQGSLDNFKIQLGLPVNLALDLDDGPIRPITEHLNRIERIQTEYEEAVAQGNKLDTVDALKLRGLLRDLFTSTGLVKATPFQKESPGRWKAWEALTDKDLTKKLSELGAERRKLLDLRAELESAGKPFPEDQQRRLEQLERERDLGGLERSLRAYERLKRADAGAVAVVGAGAGPVTGAIAGAVAGAVAVNLTLKKQAPLFREVIYGYQLVLSQARADRISQWQPGWPEVPSVEVAGRDILKGDPDPAFEVATQTALTYRLDLMNQRARVVDAWRKLAVTANALLGVFNVEYNLSAFSPRGLAQPLALDGSRVQHQLILNAQLPLVRKAERNAYRAALINYQHERRDLLALEDLIVQTVRAEIRQLRVLAANYRIQQKVVELSYSNLENAKESFQAPTGGAAPGAPIAPPSQSSAANAAALTNQLLQAQGSLNGAQNQLFGLWINYLNTRIQLYRDLELMPLDFRGVWIDELAPSEPHRDGDVPAADDRPGPDGQRAGGERASGQRPSGSLGEPILPARLLAPTSAPLEPHN
jgi:hypothetical protein